MDRPSHPPGAAAVDSEIYDFIAGGAEDEHTRALPNRGPCLFVPRDSAGRRPRALLLGLRVRDRWEDVWRSVVQLVLGTYMVWDARRQRLSQRYFADHPEETRRVAR